LVDPLSSSIGSSPISELPGLWDHKGQSKQWSSCHNVAYTRVVCGRSFVRWRGHWWGQEVI